MKIALTGIFVRDPLEAFNFYTQILGFIERVYIPEAQLFIVASPEDPEGTGLLLEVCENPAALAYQQALYKQKLSAIVFGVTDIYAEVERLKNLDVVFLQEPQNTGQGIMAILDDTCGNYIQIHQYS